MDLKAFLVKRMTVRGPLAGDRSYKTLRYWLGSLQSGLGASDINSSTFMRRTTLK